MPTTQKVRGVQINIFYQPSGIFFYPIVFWAVFRNLEEFSKKGTVNIFFEISTVQKVSNMIVEYSKIKIMPFGCNFNENQQMLKNRLFNFNNIDLKLWNCKAKYFNPI